MGNIELAVALYDAVQLFNHSAGHQTGEALCIRFDCLNNCFDFAVVLCNGVKNTAGDIVIDIAGESLTVDHVNELCVLHWNVIIIDTLDSKDFLNSVHCA